MTEMNIDLATMKVAYLANIIGSDIGSLLTPMGTLASLIWMFILRKNNIAVSWRKYFQITIVVIPVGLFVSLLSLFAWTRLFF